MAAACNMLDAIEADKWLLPPVVYDAGCGEFFANHRDGYVVDLTS